jgi:hypothetical protein
MEPNTIVKKTVVKKKEELLDELINQIQDESADKPQEEVQPIELTEQVRTKMNQLVDQILQNKQKLAKVNEIKKQLTIQSLNYTKDLQTLMKLYGLTELIKGSNKFVLDKVVRKKPLKKTEFKEVISYVLSDPAKVEKIYETAGQMSEEVVIEKLKCLKYKDH